MWDRLRIVPHHQTGRQPSTPLDDDRLRVGLGLHMGAGALNAPKGYSYSIKGGAPPPRPPREFFESVFETSPAVQEAPRRGQNRITVRTANLRPASSVYSEDSPPLIPNYSKDSATVATKYSYRYGGADEISPPSSPEPDAVGARRFPPGDVSPIDEDDAQAYPRHAALPTTDALRKAGSDRLAAPAAHRERSSQSPPQNRGPSSIPMMRRERRRQSGAATRPNQTQRAPTPQHGQSRNPPGRDAAPRWDPLTGEQTSSARGQPSQVKPAEFAQGLGITSHAWASPQNSPTAAPASFGDRVRRIAKKAAAPREGNADPAAGAFTSSSRPGWRGASGRTAIVDPVHDNPEVPPLRIPEKSSRRKLPPAVGSSSGNVPDGPDGPARRGQTPPVSPPPSETPTRAGPREALRKILPSSQHTPAATPAQPSASHRYPSPPLSGNPVGADAPTVAARELARDALAGPRALPSPTYNAHSPEPPSAIRRKPPPAHTNHQHQVSVSSVYSQQTDAPQASPLQVPDAARGPAAIEEPYVQPPSRFSITTYATSNTGTTRDDLDGPDDDNEQPPPPVPSLPADLQQQLRAQPAHDGRRPSSDYSLVTSPIDQFMTSPFAPAAPATTSITTTTINNNNNNNNTYNPRVPPAAAEPPAPTHPAVARAMFSVDRPSSTPPSHSALASPSDMNKTLPPAPPEQSAGEARDRVALLDARLRALANRRINIDRSIAQMTELMPTDTLLNSAEVVARREAEKRKVEALRAELADVRREEYELGLKLHRAYKRLDREAEWEPTTLWVRRVTG